MLSRQRRQATRLTRGDTERGHCATKPKAFSKRYTRNCGLAHKDSC